jgi:hypothetical protein
MRQRGRQLTGERDQVLLGRPKEDIERHLMAEATDLWGMVVAQEIRSQIAEIAEALFRIGQYRLGILEEEPDYLRAQVEEAGGR